MELVGFDMRGFNTSTLGGAPRSFEDFIDQAKPAPYMGSLFHYSAVESRIPSPVEQSKDFSQTVSLMLQRLYMLQCDAFSCPMERTKALSDGISEASSEVLQVNPSDSKAMGEWSKKIDGFGEEARRWKDGDQVLRDGLKFTTLNYVKRKTNHSFGHRHYCSISHPPLGMVLESELEGWDAGATILFGFERAVGDGWQVISHWQDGTNGDSKWLRGQVRLRLRSVLRAGVVEEAGP
uniref:Uncharacterized protein n=1 Tax=Moniliophthora roreri TaxID=221103 RepID=A0A0W0GE97_MONRR